MPNDSAPAPPPAKDERSHFLAHMGHDLRAPLTNILALTEALVDGVYGSLPPVQSDTLKHIRDNGHRMLQMVTDLVDLAKFETGQLQLEPAECEIMEPCRSGMLDMARGIAKSKNIVLAPETMPPSSIAVADARRVRQLASSLATAAVVSTPSDGQVRLRVQAQLSEGCLCLQAFTAKRGQTPPSEVSRGDEAAAAAALQRLRKLSSVAVGVVEKLSLLHHGTFDVAEREGTFSIEVKLPMAFPSQDPTAATSTGSATDGAAPALASPLILLADDEEIIRTITKDYLESTGCYRVVCATNGTEALDLVKSEKPDLVILDMQMPVLDGLEALQQMRQSADARIAKTPVISLSGLVTPGHRERCLAAGSNACLAKPFGIKDLERAIKEALGVIA